MGISIAEEECSLTQSHGLTASSLKRLGLITMTVDHAYKLFGWLLLPMLAEALSISRQAAYTLTTALFGIGSATVYVFLWLLGEGCRYTRSMPRYVGRLLFFAVLSELPFQLMLCLILGEPLSLHLGCTNMLFTLTLGALACWGWRILCLAGRRFLAWATVVLCCLAAAVLQTDYSLFGVLGVFACYYFSNPRHRLLALGGIILVSRGFLYPLQDSLEYGFVPEMLPAYAITLGYALLSLVFLSQYNGARGTSSKYVFYLYYPAHIAVLVLLAVWLT